MSRSDATWPAVFHVRQDLQREKDDLLMALREMTANNYWAGVNDSDDEVLVFVSARIEEITTILTRINTGAYKL